MKMALPETDRKETKREQTRKRSISRKSPAGYMVSMSSPPHTHIHTLHSRICPEDRHLSGEHKDVGEGVSRGTNQSLGINKHAQHPSSRLGRWRTLKQGGKGPESKTEG